MLKRYHRLYTNNSSRVVNYVLFHASSVYRSTPALSVLQVRWQIHLKVDTGTDTFLFAL